MRNIPPFKPHCHQARRKECKGGEGKNHGVERILKQSYPGPLRGSGYMCDAVLRVALPWEVKKN